MYSDRKICVVLLIGIPGSGKSYFRTFLEAYFRGCYEPVLGSVQMWSVCYDDHDLVRTENVQWKQWRLNIMKLVENIIKHLKHSERPLSADLGKEYSSITVVNKELKSPDSIIILIDDNMYYRSMRYEYYKLARMYNISFSQIFFKVDLEKALKCNSERPLNSRVPEKTIESMFLKLETPQTNHLWELFSVTVLSYADFTNQEVSSKIVGCLKNSLENPVKTNDHQSNNDEAHCPPSSNAIHQIDNVLKQLVAVQIRREICTKNKSQLSQISKCYSEKRLKLLKQIRGKVITLPIDLNDAVTKEKLDFVRPFLSNLLLSSD